MRAPDAKVYKRKKYLKINEIKARRIKTILFVSSKKFESFSNYILEL